jgi:hypothetical protein
LNCEGEGTSNAQHRTSKLRITAKALRPPSNAKKRGEVRGVKLKLEKQKTEIKKGEDLAARKRKNFAKKG